MTLVALRLGIGWHFYQEGQKKFSGDSEFTSVYFLQSARGPFAETFKSFIPDRFGLERLDRKKTVAFWTDYKNDVAGELGFSEEQRKQADRVLSRYEARMANFRSILASDLREYELEVQRLRERQQSKTSSISFEKERIWEKEAELRGKVTPWLSDIRSLGEQLRNDLATIASDDQLAGGMPPLPDRSKPAVDTFVKYLVLVVGILLVLGLFTRLAAAGGIAFLCSVMATQLPWAYGADTTYFYYQLVEVLALCTLIAMGAGRFAGLDYVIHGMMIRCCPPKKSENLGG